MLEPGVELGVLDGDADVAGQGFEHFHVLAGEEVALSGTAQPEDGYGALAAAGVAGGTAGDVVVEIQGCRGKPLCGGQPECVFGRFEEDMTVLVGVAEMKKA